MVAMTRMKLDNGGFTMPASRRQGHAGLPGSRWPLQDHEPPVIQQFRDLRFCTLREQLSEHSAATDVPALLERALHAHAVLVREKVHQVFNGLPLCRVAIRYGHGCIDDSSARLVVNLEARFDRRPVPSRGFRDRGIQVKRIRLHPQAVTMQTSERL